MEQTFKALVIEEKENSIFERNILTKNISELPQNEVLIQVHYSSLNYKDALSATGNKGITRKYPHTPGIDAAGIVVKSQSAKFKEGDEVICTGYDLGMNTAGGFGQYISVPADWVVARPKNVSLRNAMIIGTAGFTAMNGVMEILNHNVKPEDGKILVTGATGGVGIMAVTFLSNLGYDVIASSGKVEQYDLLRKAGAKEIIGREEVNDTTGKPLLAKRWIAAIDTVGGNVLATALKSAENYGIVATCGNIASMELNISIFPFILRGVRLIGLASAETYMQKRLTIWDKISEKFGDFDFNFLVKEVELETLSNEIDLILKGKQVGRVLVNMK
jgi:putative YhdH/YhfP family quinone oxidoreductase